MLNKLQAGVEAEVSDWQKKVEDKDKELKQVWIGYEIQFATFNCFEVQFAFCLSWNSGYLDLFIGVSFLKVGRYTKINVLTKG